MTHHHHHGHGHHHHHDDEGSAQSKPFASLARFAIAGLVGLAALLAASSVLVTAGDALVVSRFGDPVRVLIEPGLEMEAAAALRDRLAGRSAPQDDLERAPGRGHEGRLAHPGRGLCRLARGGGSRPCAPIFARRSQPAERGGEPDPHLPRLGARDHGLELRARKPREHRSLPRRDLRARGAPRARSSTSSFSTPTASASSSSASSGSRFRCARSTPRCRACRPSA